MIFLPAAQTTRQGKFDVTFYEVALPSVAYGVTDRVQIGIAGTYVPTAERIFVPGAKVELAHAAGIRLSATGALGIDDPEHGKPGYVTTVGLVGTGCNGNGSLCAGATLLSATASSVRGADRITDIAGSVFWSAGSHFDLLAEEHVRTTVPNAQVGSLTVIAVRGHWRAVSADVGWLMDVGVVGPPFPLIGPEGALGVPGIPVLNVSFALP
jgi:hypothetical protein